METQIKWQDSEGYITATYGGSGNGSAAISSSINESIDREQDITVKTTAGANPKTETVRVKQIGLREVFNASDGAFVPADGGTFNVLKVGSSTPDVPVEPEKPQIPTAPVAGVTIATSEGYFIPYAEWDNQGTAVGVCVKTDAYAIIIDLEIASKRWYSSSTTISNVPSFSSSSSVGSYNDGQAYTDTLVSMNSSTTYAAGYARSRKITIASVEYVGYLGSTGEWQKLMTYDDDIMAAFSALGGSFSGSTSSRNIWTSCQNSRSNAWRFTFSSTGFGSFGSTSKTSSAYVKALYKYE